MTTDPAAVEFNNWLGVFVLLVIGFLIGLLSNIRTGGGGTYWTVALAQIPYQFQEFRVALLPRCIMASSLFSLFCLGDPEFAGEHPLFVTVQVFSLASTAVWLFASSKLIDLADQQKQAEIELFLSDGSQPVPKSHSVQANPVWLRFWNDLNVVCFVTLVARTIVGLIAFRGLHLA